MNESVAQHICERLQRRFAAGNLNVSIGNGHVEGCVTSFELQGEAGQIEALKAQSTALARSLQLRGMHIIHKQQNWRLHCELDALPTPRPETGRVGLLGAVLGNNVDDGVACHVDLAVTRAIHAHGTARSHAPEIPKLVFNAFALDPPRHSLRIYAADLTGECFDGIGYGHELLNAKVAVDVRGIIQLLAEVAHQPSAKGEATKIVLLHGLEMLAMPRLGRESAAVFDLLSRLIVEQRALVVSSATAGFKHILNTQYAAHVNTWLLGNCVEDIRLEGLDGWPCPKELVLQNDVLRIDNVPNPVVLRLHLATVSPVPTQSKNRVSGSGVKTPAFTRPQRSSAAITEAKTDGEPLPGAPVAVGDTVLQCSTLSALQVVHGLHPPSYSEMSTYDAIFMTLEAHEALRANWRQFSVSEWATALFPNADIATPRHTRWIERALQALDDDGYGDTQLHIAHTNYKAAST